MKTHFKINNTKHKNITQLNLSIKITSTINKADNLLKFNKLNFLIH